MCVAGFNGPPPTPPWMYGEATPLSRKYAQTAWEPPKPLSWVDQHPHKATFLIAAAVLALFVLLNAT